MTELISTGDQNGIIERKALNSHIEITTATTRL